MPSKAAADDSRRSSAAAAGQASPTAAAAAAAARPDEEAPSPGTAAWASAGSGAAPTRATSTSASPPPPPSKKPRTTKGGSTGSRGVANLTSEQLAKKRANDREAQRAIRERTRHQIENLERRIEELTSQQPYQELQAALKQKELVEAENAEIKRRLHAVLGIIQPLLEGTGMTGLSTPAIDDHRADFARASIAHAPVFAPNGGATADPYSPSSATTGGVSMGSRTYSTPWPTGMPPVSEGATSMPAIPGVRPARPGDPVSSLLPATSVDRATLGFMPLMGRPPVGAAPSPIATSSAADTTTQDGRRISLPSDSHITLSTSPHVPDDGTSPSSSNIHPPPSPISYTGVHRSSDGYRNEPAPGSYCALPLNIAASCTLDGIMLDFLTERRRAATQGVPELELLGPRFPDFTYFMLPSTIRKQRRAHHPLSQLLTDVILTFPDIHASPEKVATYYGMYLALQWMVQPTQTQYERMLPFIRPTPWQLTTPHPVWIDLIPWPAMRDGLVKAYSRYLFDEFFVPFTKTVSVNWPYADEAVFSNGPPPMPHPDQLGEPLKQLELTPIFQEHIKDIRNWSVGPSFVHVYPELAPPSVRIEEKREDS